MKFKALAVLWVVLALCQCTAASDSITTDMPKQDYWMGICYDQSQIGSLHVTVRKGRVNGKDGWIRDEISRIHYRTADKSHTLDIDRELFADDNYHPISDTLTSDGSDCQPLSMAATFGSGVGKLKTTSGETTDEKTIPLLEEDQANLASGCRYDLGGRTLSPGDTFDLSHMHNIMNLLPDGRCMSSVDVTTVLALRREKIMVGGKGYNTLVASETSENVDIIRWQLANGEVIKEKRPTEHLVFLRETKKDATKVDEGPGPLLDTQAKPEPTPRPDAHLLRSFPANADYWMGVYSGSSKIGYLHVAIKPDKFGGKDVFRKDERFHVWPNRSPKRYGADFSHTVYAGNDLCPVFEEATGGAHDPSSQAGNSMLLQTRYNPESIDVTVTSEGKTSTNTEPESKECREMLIAGCTCDFGMRKLDVGDSINVVHWCWAATNVNIGGRSRAQR